MSVRASLLFALVVAGATKSGFSQDTGSEGFAPEIRAIEDYEHVWTRSPFVVETKVVAESDPLAQKYALAAIARMNGKPCVFLIERATHQRIMIPSKDHALEVVSVSMDRDLRKSSVVIRLGSEQASITYDEMLLGQTGAAAAAPHLTAQGGVRARPIPAVPSSPVVRPTTAVPAPPKRSIIQAPPGVPRTPDEDNDDAQAPKSKSIIKRPSINPQR